MHLEIVEPTLNSEAGHCALLLRSLHAAAPDLPCRVWSGQAAGGLFPDLASIEIKPHFARRWRKPQALLLYGRLLRAPSPLLVPTAGRFDLEAIAFAAPGRIGPGRVFLYFHRLELTPAKARALRRIAARQPELVTIGTTGIIEARLRETGFRATATMLPMPPPLASTCSAAPVGFRRVVVAGAARADKGFEHAVDLVQLLAERDIALPIALQVSGDHHARHDPVTRGALARLALIRCPSATTLPETLDAASFAELMRGAICLQPYRRADYADKISAITLDALNAAAPIVTIDGTWMAELARRYGCGAIAPGAQPQALLAAIETVRSDYAAFSARAAAAAAALAASQAWQPLLERIGGIRRTG